MSRSYELSEAISRLTVKQPFFAVLIYDLMKIVETRDIPTAATDGKTIFVNPDFFKKLNIEERVGVLCHEVLHVILEHCPRMRLYKTRGFGPDLKPWSNVRWNYATDYIINDILAKSGVGKLPHGALYHPDYGLDDIADEIYPKMPEEEDEDNWDIHLPGKEDGPTKGDVQRTVAGATEAAKSMGNMPAGMERIVNDILDPKVDWREKIQLQVINYAKRDEQSYARPNRKRLALSPHIYMPGRVGHSTGHIVVIGDTSGSVSPKEWRYFFGGMCSLLEQVAPETLHIGSCDTRVSDLVLVEDMSDIESYKPVGGGGTHMPAIFDYLEQEDITPDCLVILTDGWTDFGKPPGYPVIWVITDNGKTAPHGDTIHISMVE